MMEKFSHTPGREIAKDRSDWLLDAIAGATQDRRFLRGDPAYDEVVGEAILLNAEKAICVALDRAAAPELLEALRVADDAIKEMFRYYDGGETRGSYDGKPERAQLRKAGYTARAAIAKAMGE